jgi:hypothetical protein
MGSGGPGVEVTLNDTLVSGSSFPGLTLSIGDIVVLSAGMLTIDGVIGTEKPAPVGIDFSTFILGFKEGSGLSGPGTVSGPDSLSTLWLGLPIGVMLAFAQLRRFAARFQSA